MELPVLERNILGKKVSRFRKEGQIPAELFGRGIKNRHFFVLEKDFLKIYQKAGEHDVITLKTENGEKIPVLISEVSQHHLSGIFLNINFRQVSRGEKIKTKIPIHWQGEAPAVKKGFDVIKVLNEIEIEAEADKIPSYLEVDLTRLEELDQNIKAADIYYPKEVKIVTSPEVVIATVSEKEKEEERLAKPLAAAITETIPPTETVSAPRPSGAEEKT